MTSPGHDGGRAGWFRYGPVCFIAFILILSFIARLPCLFIERLWPDEALYLTFVQWFLNDPSSIFRTVILSGHPPLFPIILSLGRYFAPDMAGFHAITVLINLSGIVLVFELARRSSGLFSGALGAVFLAVNVIYYQHAGLILIDGLLTVAYLSLAIALLNARLSGDLTDKRTLAGISAAAIFVCLCKGYGVFLVLPVLVLYFFIAFQDLKIVDRARSLGITCFFGLLPLLPLFILSVDFLRTTGGPGVCFNQPAGYYPLIFNVLPGGPLQLVSFVLGIYFLAALPGIRSLFYIMLIVPLAVMSFGAEKDIRYILPVVPLLAIIGGLGVKGVVDLCVRDPGHRRVVKWVVLLASLLLFVPFFQHKDEFLSDRGYTGYGEAGSWIRSHVAPQDIIFAGSRRQMRYVTGIGFGEDGGRIFPVRMPREQFHPVRTQRVASYLVVDRWEFFHQPDWLYPFDDIKKAALEKAGFVLVKEFHKVIWVFRYDPPALSKAGP